MDDRPEITEGEGDRVRRWRRDTPAAAAGRIHLNNAGAALVPVQVDAIVREHLDREQRLGGYEAADAARGRVDRVYEQVGGVIGAAARNIAVVENATVGLALALSAYDPGPGDVILTTRNDYVSNQLMYLSLARRRGVEVVRAKDLPEGGVDPESVRTIIRQRRPALVSLTWIPTNAGLVQPAEAVGEVCEDAGVPYVVDACQAVGQMPIDAPSLRCDFLAASARKFLRGPRGIGFLYVSDRALSDGLAPLYPDMRGGDWMDADQYRLREDARRFENWEFPYALVLGMGEAAWYAAEVGLETARDRAWGLAADLRERLQAADGVRVLDRGETLCAIVTAEVEGRDAAGVVAEMREQGINTSALERSSAVIDMDEKGATTAIRLSPHYYNTGGEIGAAAAALESLIRE
jgi:selenocysteine lyase/cysteine desulfurase